MDDSEIKSCSMDKEIFVQRYVLNRARACNLGLDGLSAAKEAVRAYEKIQEVCKKIQ